MKALYKRRFSFQDKLNVWLTMISMAWDAFFAEDSEWHGVGCWLRSLECTVDAWQGSSFGLTVCQLANLAGCGICRGNFSKRGGICPRRDCFYIFNYERTAAGSSLTNSLARKRKRGCTQKRTNSILQEPLVQVMYLLGIHSKVPAKEIWITNFSLGAQHADLLDTTANGTSQVFLLDIQLCHGYLEVKQFSFGCQPIQDH